MSRIFAALWLALAVSACDMMSTVTEGMNQARAVESDLEQATGLRPQVGFNWQNGQLRSVTVSFPRLYEGKPLRELADVVRAAVDKEFKQTPDTVLLAFALAKTPAR